MEVLPEWEVVVLALLLCVVVFWGVVAGLACFGSLRSTTLSSLRPLQAVDEATAAAVCFGVMVLRPCLRCAVGPSSPPAMVLGL